MTKAITIRLPVELYEESLELAHARRTSLNVLVQESLRAAVKVEEERRLFEAFGEIGKDAEEADVEFAAEAQWEVLRDDE